MEKAFSNWSIVPHRESEMWNPAEEIMKTLYYQNKGNYANDDEYDSF